MLADSSDIENKLNMDLNFITDWPEVSGLVINSSKSEYVIVETVEWNN